MINYVSSEDSTQNTLVHSPGHEGPITGPLLKCVVYEC